MRGLHRQCEVDSTRLTIRKGEPASLHLEGQTVCYVDDMKLTIRTYPKAGQNPRLTTYSHLSSTLEGEADRIAAILQLNPKLRRAPKLRRVYWFVSQKRRRAAIALGARQVSAMAFHELSRKPYRSAEPPRTGI